MYTVDKDIVYKLILLLYRGRVLSESLSEVNNQDSRRWDILVMQELNRLIVGEHSTSDADSSKQENLQGRMIETTKTKNAQNLFCKFLHLQILDSSLSCETGDTVIHIQTDTHTHRNTSRT